MNKQQKLLILVFILTILCFLLSQFGHAVGRNAKKLELEQTLCELKQYEYCTKEELLKTIK